MVTFFSDFEQYTLQNKTAVLEILHCKLYYLNQAQLFKFCAILPESLIQSAIHLAERWIQSVFSSDTAHSHWISIHVRRSVPVVKYLLRKSTFPSKLTDEKQKENLSVIVICGFECTIPHAERRSCWIRMSVRVTGAFTFTCSKADIHTQRWVTIACPWRGIVHSV